MNSPQSVNDLFALISERYHALKKERRNKQVKTNDLFESAVDYVFGLWGATFNIPSASELKGAFGRTRGKNKKTSSVTVDQAFTPTVYKKQEKTYSLDMSLEEQIETLGLNADSY